MIKINDILKHINQALKTHYFKDITSYEVAELLTREDIDEKEVTRPAILEENGDYSFLQIDSNGLNIYHRIIGEIVSEEDFEAGYGRNPLITETYPIRIIFFGQSSVIEKDNITLAKEFKSLIPRSVDIRDSNKISVTGFEVDRSKISKEEFIDFVPNSILFTIDLDIIIKGINICDENSCGTDPEPICKDATILDSDGVTKFNVASGDNGTCTPLAPIRVSNSDDTFDVNTLVDLELDDITHIDSDLSPVTLPAQTPMVCTPGGGVINKTLCSYFFDGDNARIHFGNSFDDVLEGSSKLWSIRTVFKLTVLGAVDWMFSNWDGSGNQRSLAITNINDNKFVIFFSSNGSGVSGTWTSDDPITDLLWHDLIVTYNAGTVIVYLDGISLSGTSSTIPSTLFQSTAEILYGGGNAGALVASMYGNQLSIADEIFTAQDAIDLYNGGSPRITSDIVSVVSEYLFDDDVYVFPDWNVVDNIGVVDGHTFGMLPVDRDCNENPY